MLSIDASVSTTVSRKGGNPTSGQLGLKARF
jgi:hypothetical protein